MNDLGEFEGKPVVASKMIVKNAGDGLSKPLAAEPRAWHSGDRIPMLLWGTIQIGGMPEVKEGVGHIRVHHFITEEAAVLDHVDPELLDTLMASQRERVREWEREQMRLAAEAKGIVELPMEPDADPSADPFGAAADDWQAEAAGAAATPISGRRKRTESE